MKIDRSLIGVVAIALVLSTLITLFIVGERGAPYSVVKSEYSASGRGRWLAGVNLLAKRSMGSLRLSHFCLVNRTELIADVDRDGTPEEVSSRIPALASYLNICGGAGQEPRVEMFRMKMPRWLDSETRVEKEFDLLLYDFSEFVWQAVPDDIMHSLERPRFGLGRLWDYYNVFACLFDEEGNLTYFYEGVADFYLNKVIIIEELTIQRNDDKSVYYGVTKEDESEDALSVLNAPDRGDILFEDIRRNDRFSIYYSMDSSKRPLKPTGQGQHEMYKILHIVRITVDEAEKEFITNTVNPPRPSPIV